MIYQTKFSIRPILLRSLLTLASLVTFFSLAFYFGTKDFELSTLLFVLLFSLGLSSFFAIAELIRYLLFYHTRIAIHLDKIIIREKGLIKDKIKEIKLSQLASFRYDGATFKSAIPVHTFLLEEQMEGPQKESFWVRVGTTSRDIKMLLITMEKMGIKIVRSGT